MDSRRRGEAPKADGRDLLKGLTSQQTAAVLHNEGPALVLAAPGSGKTAALTRRVAYLVKVRGVDPSSVLAVTFTNRAAKEMKERVHKLVDNYHVAADLTISTFHSLCARLLRESASRFGVNRKFTICDETDVRNYIVQAISSLLGKQAKEDDKANPDTIRRFISNAKQKLKTPEAMAQDGADALMTSVYLKYTTLMEKANSLDFDDLLFRVVQRLGKDAALRRDLAEVYDYVLVDEYQDTNHAQFSLSRYLSERTKNLFVVGDPDQCCLNGTSVLSGDLSQAPIESIHKEYAVSSLNPQGHRISVPVEAVLHSMYSGPVVSIHTYGNRYLEVTANHHCFFRDLSVQPTANAYDPQFFFIGKFANPFLVCTADKLAVGDEIPVVDSQGAVGVDTIDQVDIWNTQDTQVHDLTVPNLHNYVANGVVVHNSIYKFRGADLSNILLFEKHYPGARTYLLEANFRSKPAITAVANAIITNNTDRPTKEIKPTKLAGERDEVRCLCCAVDRHEADVVGLEIKRALARGASPSDFAVLYRRKVQSRLFEEFFVRNNIPHRVVGSFGFYNRAVVKDVLSYLRLRHNSRDDASFTRIYNKPLRRLGNVAFGKLCESAETSDVSLYKALRRRSYKGQASNEATAGFEQLRRTLYKLRKIPDTSVGTLMEEAVQLSGYRRWLIERTKTKSPAEKAKALSQIDHLNELIVAGKQFDEDRGSGLIGFLEWITLLQKDDQEDAEAQKWVLLMTCHASKGLEFPCVYVVGCDDSNFPLIRSVDDFGRHLSRAEIERAVEEERRLFFVAATRAEDRLTLTWTPPGRVMANGHQLPSNKVSRFIEEAGALVTHTTLDGGGAQQQHREFSTGKPYDRTSCFDQPFSRKYP